MHLAKILLLESNRKIDCK